MARTLVLSEHTLLRQGLSRLIKEESSSTAAVIEAESVEQALAKIRISSDASMPEVILLHVTDPVSKHLQTLRTLRDSVPAIPVVLLVETVSDEIIVAAMQVGASGCLDSGVDAARLIQALGEAVEGEITLSDSLARRVARMLGSRRNGHDRGVTFDALTPREAEILSLLSQGLTNREIARKLFVSESTVRAHLRTVTQKLGVSNRVHAVARAMSLGMVPAPAGGPDGLPDHRFLSLALLVLPVVAALAEGAGV